MPHCEWGCRRPITVRLQSTVDCEKHDLIQFVDLATQERQGVETVRVSDCSQLSEKSDLKMQGP